jgi:hypothetical protein
MIHLRPRTRPKANRLITIDQPVRDDYFMRFVLRHKSWRLLLPDQQAAVLAEGANQLETWASQMREEAETIAMP